MKQEKKKTSIRALPKNDANTLTKSQSITLPQYLIDRLNQMELSGQGVNISKTIRFILEDYFTTDGNGKIFQELKDDEILLPIDLYASIMQIGKIAVRSRATKGDIEITVIYGHEYVKLPKDDPINIYGQVKLYRNEIKNMQNQIKELEENYKTISSQFSALKKTSKKV